MGAKLSKKKKGYCLGAGKDGESTETTEVEQKEAENQEGQKDAAEPKGEKSPTDQSQNNGVNEGPKDRKSDAEITTGETTKDESNQDQKPEIKSSTEQEKVDKNDQLQGKKEHDEGKTAAPEEACEKEKEVESASEDKIKTEREAKETLTVAADKPTQESKLVKDCKQPHSSETKQLNPVQDEAEVKQVSEPVAKVEAEKTEKAPVPLETEVHILKRAAEVPTQANQSVVEPEKLEKVPEKVEPSTPESVRVEPVSEPVVEAVVPEPVIKTEVVEATFSKPVQLTEEKVDSALPNSDPTLEPVHSVLPEPVAEPVEPASKEPHLAPEPSLVPATQPEPSLVPTPKPVKSALPEANPEIKVEEAVSEQPTALQEPEKDPEPVLSPASENIGDAKHEQELTSAPLPPKSSDVPDETAEAEKLTENQESLGCGDQGIDVVTIEVPIIEAASIKQPSEISEQHAATEAPVLQNGPSENSAEDYPVEAHPISTELKVENKEEQKEVVEENGDLDKQSTQQESQVVTDCSAPIDVLVTSKNEKGYTTAQDTHDASQHCNSEDKTENHDSSAEEVKNENKPPAPEILEKHGVGNGLPIKEEIKVHLENNCDKDLHDLNGPSESHEIQVCNE
ncbi:PREDICTED: titin homolog [Nanorana parkeri]|uniref:titin homolog n=1 Tax=Nanorana parkeri TaxID=125878 RepID=UPI0008548BC7|nr:PREDICTED: titin homolog [Nanorana parkeri]